MTPWHCPRCGREFARRGQTHSCVSIPLEDHFAGKPTELREMFDQLLTALRRSGVARVDAVKSALNIGGKRHFAMVSVQSDGLKVEFVLDRELRNPRVLRSQRLSDTWYSHSVKLRKGEGVDTQLLEWLREAQSLGGRLS